MAATSVVEPIVHLKPSADRFYRPELDCLRFFAFLAVFVHHSFSGDATYYTAHHIPFGVLIASAVSAGRFGVDLFFLLSAFLITELLLREQERFGKVDLGSFYARRILRIWPLYFLGILIAVVLPWIDSQQYFPVRYGAAFVFMLGNWIGILGLPVHSVMWSLWSVSFEEQFYLLWPAFISRARRETVLLIAAATLFLAATIGRQVLLVHARALHSELAIFTCSVTRLDPIALGIATAVLLRRRQPSFGVISRAVLLVAGLALWMAAGYDYKLSRGFMLLGYPAVTLGAWFIFLSNFGFPFAPRILRYLGKISYGLYVFHLLALYWAFKLFGGQLHTLRRFVLFWILSLSLTLAMAALSYRFFESPFLRLKERFARVKSRPV